MNKHRHINHRSGPPSHAPGAGRPERREGNCVESHSRSDQWRNSRYPLLSEKLTINEMSLRDTYTINDVANCFGITVRAIQDRVSSGQLTARYLRGRAKFPLRRTPPS
jgi:hypothetical protein